MAPRGTFATPQDAVEALCRRRTIDHKEELA
jgi:hypothetical protein